MAGGCSVKTAQELARHSTPTLTIGRYSHARLHDLTAALDALPDLATPPEMTATRESAKATGTHDASPVSAESFCGSICGSSRAAKTGSEGAIRGECQSDDETFKRDCDHGQDDGPNILQLRDLAINEPQAAERGESEKRQEKQEAPVGVEPTNGGFANRCLSHLATAPAITAR